MFRKGVTLSIMASLFCSTIMYGEQAYAALAMEGVYAYIQRGQLQQLSAHLQNGSSLDVVDQNGNTALCQAILNRDRVMVQRLIRLGANRNTSCMRKMSESALKEVGLVRKQVNLSNKQYQKGERKVSLVPAVWKTRILLGLGLIGGVAAVIALTHGGSGSGEAIKGADEKTVLDVVNKIKATLHSESCPNGMSLINGVCTTPVTPGADGKTPISKESTTSPYYLAEFGGSVTNTGSVSYKGSTTAPVIAMQANGVSVGALSADGKTVYLSGASSATNAGGASITMKETSASDKGVIALYGTSAGTINNNGTISITSKSSAESAGLKVDRDDAEEAISGDGANIENNGTITVTDQGDGTGLLSAVSAPGRNVTNNGKVNIVLDTTGGVVSADSKGRAQGLYGKSVSNAGTITLSTNAKGADTPINTEVYLTRGYGDEGSIVANDGTLNMDLTNIAWGIYGVWSDEAAGTGSTVKNTGNINVSGELYSDPAQVKSKKVYLIGSEGGVTNIQNLGPINVGTKDKPVDVSQGGVMNAMYGISGTMRNKEKLNFNLKADPSVPSDSFTALAMFMEEGSMTNDGDITYRFSNEKAGVTSTQTVDLTAIDTLSATITNNADIQATLKGTAADGSKFTAISDSSGNVTNTGNITVNSTVDNMDLTGMTTGSGSVTNAANSKISLKTTGENADLTGAKSAAGGVNEGYVYLTHDGGSGNISGYDGGNQGYIQIKAMNMTGSSRISGGQAQEGVSEGTGSSVDDDSVGRNRINIALTGQTNGNVYGYEYKANKTGVSSVSGNTVNISAIDPARSGDLTVYGITAESLNSIQRNGTINLNVLANATDRTKVVGISATDSNVTNNDKSVVNLNVDLNNSTNHSVIGMELTDSSISGTVDDGVVSDYKAWNAGTLNLNITGQGANTTSDANVPFDIVGMATNAYALNTGIINLNVDSENAKVAGMVAYDGGMIVNQGVINFDGYMTNFVPLYATGHRVNTTIVEPTDEEKLTSDTWEKREIVTDAYGTIYNLGHININKTETSVTPVGEGYYAESMLIDPKKEAPYDPTSATPIDFQARRIETTIYECSASGCTQIEKEGVDNPIVDDNRSSSEFTAYSNPLPTPTPKLATPKKTTAVMAASTPSYQTVSNATNVSGTNQKSVLNMVLNNGMRYVTETGGDLFAEGIHMIGDVTAGTTLVQGSNADSYLASGAGEGVLVTDGDYSDLSLSSNSAMFDATYTSNKQNKNGIDIIMTRRSFDEFVDNASLAGYLEKNYAAGNNVSFFDKLKSFGQFEKLSSALNALSGRDILPRFSFEDMTMMRELNFDMNDHLFHNTEPNFALAGTVTPMAFKGDLGSSAKYSLFNKKQGKYSIGLGVAFSNIKSDDAQKENGRKEMMYQMIVPIGFKMLGFDFVTSPRIGYARGTYDRTGFDNKTYDGTVEKRMFGLMNEARYPIPVGNWTFEPSAEINILGYEQRGHEKEKDYSLNIQSQNTYSVESGIGFYVTKAQELSKNSRLKVLAGMAAYHEFADPYRIKVGMQGMDGSFTLRDEDVSDNRAVLRARFDYEKEDFSLYGSIISFINREIRTSLKSGMKMKF